MIVKNPVKETYNFRNAIVTYYLIAMFSLFPLFLTKQYAQVISDKFFLFIILSGILVLGVVIYSLFYLGENESNKNVYTPAHVLKLSITDIAFLAFFICAAISTIFSKYKLESLTGNEGRKNGLILLFVYLLVYIAITRFYITKDYVFAFLLVFFSIVAILTVLNYFYIDPIGLLNGYSEKVQKDFGSTIGNKNTTASFMCLFLPVAVMLFILAKKKYLQILSGFAICFSFMGFLCSDSSSGYIGLFFMIMAIAIFSVRKYTYLKYFSIAMIIMFASGKLLRLFSLILQDNSKPFEDYTKFFIFDTESYLFVATFFIIFLLLILFKEPLNRKYPKTPLLVITIVIFSIMILAVIALFIYFSTMDTDTELNTLTKVFRFNEKWGTHRGYMWINGLKEYQSFNFFEFLFGSGPDTFGLVFEKYNEGLKAFGNDTTNCIHSEPLNYLVTQGLLGLLSYLAIFVTLVVRAVKKINVNPFIMVALAPVICYMGQSVVNIYQPITTPIFFIFIAISEALIRDGYKINIYKDIKE